MRWAAAVLAAGLLTAFPLAAFPLAASAQQDTTSQENPPTTTQEPEPCLPAPPKVEPSVPWGQRQLAPERVWPLTDGTGITVAVVDTGVDASIPQLRGAVLPGVDTTQAGPANTDCFGHGTFVAGIIGARAVSGTGYVGVAPGVRILPIRCATTDDPSVAGALTPEGMAAGIRAAVDGGARVINVSASTTERNAALADAVAYAEKKDVVVVASAANSAEQGESVTYPAAYPSVIAVGAVDEAGKHAQFSQTGQFVSLVAPGVDVVGLGPGGGGHWTGSGTSYSAPFVTGVVALVRAYRPGLSAAEVKARLLATASHPAVRLPDPALGWGMVDPLAAVTMELPGEGSVVLPPDAVAAPVVVVDEVGGVVAVAGLVGGVVVVLFLGVVLRVGGRGRRRGFRAARVVEVRE
ncbi:type VII secretion-associated serine protease mycosin [Actinokineospora guangxiensis]|uniref:Type VII secretion-associated serine protease mycosin n=1 Tax=Actinokineospora guangxiensis TaxID=1490288 RepID=A0ABW0EY91_9PSEU